MGVKIFGHSPSSLTETTPTARRDIPAFQLSGMTGSFGGLAVCLYAYDYTNDIWVPYSSNRGF